MSEIRVSRLQYVVALADYLGHPVPVGCGEVHVSQKQYAMCIEHYENQEDEDDG